jgi:AraC family transcriptional regulator
MPATPLTDERWPGLPLLECNMDPGRYCLDMQTVSLIVRDDTGMAVEVLNKEGRRCAFLQAPMRFDLYTPGLQVYATSNRLATKSFVVHLPAEWLPIDYGCAEGHIEIRPRFQFADPVLKRLAWRLRTHHQYGEPLGHAYSEAVSRVLVERLTGLQLATEARDSISAGLSPEARWLVEKLVEDSLHEALSVAMIASKVGMGLAAFARAFKVSFRATPHQYVRQRRIARAQELLTVTDASLMDIAIETGFANHSHFATSFRACTGLTPTAFRRLALAGRSARAK